jgi:hypothetical protein
MDSGGPVIPAFAKVSLQREANIRVGLPVGAWGIRKLGAWQIGRLGGLVMITTAGESVGVRFGLQIAIAISFCILARESRAYTFEQQQACMGDAFRLCSSEIPDVDRVRTCMVRQQSQLSPGCRVYFRPEPVDPPATTSVSMKPAHIRKWHKPRKHIQHDDT